MDKSYKFEDIREFYVHRSWLHHENGGAYWMLTTVEYGLLKERNLDVSPERAMRIRAFMDGWNERGK